MYTDDDERVRGVGERDGSVADVEILEAHIGEYKEINSSSAKILSGRKMRELGVRERVERMRVEVGSRTVESDDEEVVLSLITSCWSD